MYRFSVHKLYGHTIERERDIRANWAFLDRGPVVSENLMSGQNRLAVKRFRATVVSLSLGVSLSLSGHKRCFVHLITTGIITNLRRFFLCYYCYCVSISLSNGKKYTSLTKAAFFPLINLRTLTNRKLDK